MRLVLIRHAESLWNRERRLQGVADSPLTDSGAEEARRLAGFVETLGIDRAVTSNLERARNTAGLLGLEPSVDPAWREADLGSWTGLLASDIDPDDYLAWRQGNLDPPGGETMEEFRARVAEALSQVPEGTTAIVTHGGVIRAVLWLTIGLDPKLLAPVVPASVTIVDELSDPRLVAYNLNPGFLVEAGDTE